MQFYGISCVHPHKQCGRWHDVLDKAHRAIDHTAYMDAGKKYHKTACTGLPEDKHLYVRNMSKTL